MNEKMEMEIYNLMKDYGNDALNLNKVKNTGENPSMWNDIYDIVSTYNKNDEEDFGSDEIEYSIKQLETNAERWLDEVFQIVGWINELENDETFGIDDAYFLVEDEDLFFIDYSKKYICKSGALDSDRFCKLDTCFSSFERWLEKC